jgi:hypothetical protein
MRNHERIIRINPDVNSQASLLELPGPEYSSSDEESLAQVKSLIQDLSEKHDQLGAGLDSKFGQNRLEISGVEWDKNQARLEFIVRTIFPLGT